MKKQIFLIHLLYTLFVSNLLGGQVNTFTTDSGIKVIHSKSDEHPLIAIELFFKGGNFLETREAAGISHFTQSVMLKGTKTKTANDIAVITEDIGSSVNSDMGQDYSVLSMSVLDKFAEDAFLILSDILLNPSFDEKEVENERHNILAGIKSRKDGIFNTTDDKLNDIFYPNSHPYSWPTIGYESSIETIIRTDLINWHKKYYCKNNLLVSVVGNIEKENVRILTEKYLSSMPQGTVSKTLVAEEFTGIKSETIESDKFEQAFLMVAFQAPNVRSSDYPALKVINSILGSRMSGRLFTELRENLSLAYEVSSYYPSRNDLSKFVIYIGLKSENVELAENKIFEILKDIKENAVSNTELDETKRYISGTFIRDHESINRQVWYQGFWEILGLGLSYDAKYLTEINKITSEDVRKTANKYFKDNYAIVRTVPSK